MPVHPVPRLLSRIGPLLFAEVAYIRASGPEDSQAQELEHGHEGEVVRVRGLVAGGLRGCRPQVRQQQRVGWTARDQGS